MIKRVVLADSYSCEVTSDRYVIENKNIAKAIEIYANYCNDGDNNCYKLEELIKIMHKKTAIAHKKVEIEYFENIELRPV